MIRLPDSDFLPPRRLPLPLWDGNYTPRGSSTILRAHPQTRVLLPERLLIEDAVHWHVNAIRVDGLPGPLVQDLPGAAFAFDAPGRLPGAGEVELSPDRALIVEVTYTGPRHARVFRACALGSDDRGRTRASASPPGHEERIATARSGKATPPLGSAQLATFSAGHDVWPTRIAIEDASSWIVRDVRVGEVSIFAQSGEVPGGLLSPGGDDTEPTICLGRLAAGDVLSVVATYVGLDPGAELAYELYGVRAPEEGDALPVAAILPMSGGVSILPGMHAQMTSRCQPPADGRRGIRSHQSFLPRRIVVERAADWTLRDVAIGRTSQFAQAGELPGLVFDSRAVGCEVSLDVAQAGVDVVVQATYDGPSESGDFFVCGILGCVVDRGEAPRSPSRRGRILSARDLR